MSANHSESICFVVRLPNWVGDVCMVLPSLALLAQTGLPMILCGKPFARALVKNLPNHQFVEFGGKVSSDVKSLKAVLPKNKKRLRGLLFPDSLTSAMVFKLSGISSLGYRDDGRSLLLRWPIHKPQNPTHAVMKWYGLIQAAQMAWHFKTHAPLPEKPAPYCFVPDIQAQTEVRNLLKENALTQGQYILIAPTATGLHKGKIKVWPHFAELTQQLLAAGFKVVMCPPAHESEQAKQAAPDAQLLSPLGLEAFCELARQAAFVVCNDSGVSHLSALVQANQLTLFGVTSPAHTAPWSEHAECLGSLNAWPGIDVVLQRCLTMLKLQNAASSL